MTPRPIDIPMARAHAHLTGARYPQAIGAFRAAVAIDSRVVGAHLGLADALTALGRRYEAIEELVAAAQTFTTCEAHAGAMSLLDKALVLDPSRVELHLDMAMAEEAMGRHGAAVMRVEGLAERYMDDGRTDEGAELLRFLATWGQDGEDERSEPVPAAPEMVQPEMVQPEMVLPEMVQPEMVLPEMVQPEIVQPNLLQPDMIVQPEIVQPNILQPDLMVPWHTAIITGETVIARNPLLPPLPAPEVLPADLETKVARAPAGPGAVDIMVEIDADSVTRVADVRQFSPRPVTPASRRTTRPRPPADTHGNPVVDRLRARAGLGHATASPRRVDVRATEPIAIRPSLRTWLPREEDVTLRFRRPRGLDAAS